MGPGKIQRLSFADLDGWAACDLSPALGVFLGTCDQLGAGLSAAASRASDARRFFEAHFTPVVFGSGPALFTGYYEPELRAALTRQPGYEVPLFALPSPDLRGASRSEIAHGALNGQGLELAWAADLAEAFFLQVQGSGRLVLPDGNTLRLGFAGKNGLEYRSVGQELIRRGVFTPDSITAQGIKDWIRAQPEAGAKLLLHNPSYVYFRALPDLPADQGPLGTLNHPVTEGISLAVDPDFTPLGAPVWLERPGQPGRLMVAQDTGSAIKGPQRADVFCGSGAGAGALAGAMQDSGRMVTLLPKTNLGAADVPTR